MTEFQNDQILLGVIGLAITIFSIIFSVMIKIFYSVVISPLKNQIFASTEKLTDSINMIREALKDSNTSRKENEKKLFETTDDHEIRITTLEKVSEFHEKQLSKIVDEKVN